MAFDIKALIQGLEICEERLKDLQQLIVEFFDDLTRLETLVNQQCIDKEETKCLCCNDEGDCAILNGGIYLQLNSPHALDELERAKQCLGKKYETWNQITGLVLLGITHERNGHIYLALREYRHALEILQRIYLRVHQYDYIKKASALETELIDKITNLSSSSLSPTPAAEIELPRMEVAAHSIKKSPETNTQSPPPLFENDSDYLALFAVPIYGTAEAGPNGEAHIHHLHDTYTIINQVELEGKIFRLHNLHGVSASDRQINLESQKTYGWLHVHGLSMNGWDIPFNEGDYVLFYESVNQANHLDFVIVSNLETPNQTSLLVKRYDKTRDVFVSNSKNTTFADIPRDDSHQISGIVIAIAKPID